MLAELKDTNGFIYKVNLQKPIDISIPMENGDQCVNAFYISAPRFEPFRAGGFVGSVAEGGSCNCEDLHINAHGNGTHTECVGHIARERITIHQTLQEFHFAAELISVQPDEVNGDRIVQLNQLQELVKYPQATALVIRTLPNASNKLNAHYSGSNPIYIHHQAAQWIREKGYKHLLVDFPSVDREEDGGELLAHHAFWNYPQEAGGGRTITEMIYVPDSVHDGLYLLNIQIASLQTDASPSKPVLYQLL